MILCCVIFKYDISSCRLRLELRRVSWPVLGFRAAAPCLSSHFHVVVHPKSGYATQSSATATLSHLSVIPAPVSGASHTAWMYVSIHLKLASRRKHVRARKLTFYKLCTPESMNSSAPRNAIPPQVCINILYTSTNSVLLINP